MPPLGELALEALGLRMTRPDALALVRRLGLLARHEVVMTQQEAERARRAQDPGRADGRGEIVDAR